jgi:hypothetical protein
VRIKNQNLQISTDEFISLLLKNEQNNSYRKNAIGALEYISYSKCVTQKQYQWLIKKARYHFKRANIKTLILTDKNEIPFKPVN